MQATIHHCGAAIINDFFLITGCSTFGNACCVTHLCVQKNKEQCEVDYALLFLLDTITAIRLKIISCYFSASLTP